MTKEPLVTKEPAAGRFGDAISTTEAVDARDCTVPEAMFVGCMGVIETIPFIPYDAESDETGPGVERPSPKPEG